MPFTFVNQVTNIALVLLVILLIESAALFVFYVESITTKVAPQTCASFVNYQQAVQAYNAGNTALDHNKNGIPCESLL